MHTIKEWVDETNGKFHYIDPLVWVKPNKNDEGGPRMVSSWEATMIIHNHSNSEATFTMVSFGNPPNKFNPCTRMNYVSIDTPVCAQNIDKFSV
jgi:hypothetical protein